MIRVGVAGWDYPDWNGVVYPAHTSRGFDRLAFLANYFDVIEINTSFYRIPSPTTARSWASRVSSTGYFTFTAKLHRDMTHAPPGGEADGAMPAPEEAAARYREAIEPLLEAGRLGAVLMQFPHAFHDRPRARERLQGLAGLLRGLPLVAEFRHRSWDHADALQFLHELGIGFCNIDQPSVGSTLRPTGHVTSPIAYVRLHGRNADAWFRPDASVAERYDCLYSDEELRPWAERAERLAERAEEVFIVANNHYRGKAPVSALMLKSALTRRRVAAPPELLASYPELVAKAVARGAGPEQGSLF